MKRVTVALLILGLFAASGAQGAEGRKHVRTATEEYSGAQAILIGYESTPSVYAGDCDPATDQGCVRFLLKKRDRFFTLKIQDQTGLPVYAVVFSGTREIADVCGKTTEPVASPGRFIDVWLTYGTCYESPTPSFPTIGTVQASFSWSRSDLSKED